jgi:hypothetical protein
MLEGMAKPIPILPPEVDKICELMPINSPVESMRAPPEFP